MSYDEKKQSNRFRFSREISLGDIIAVASVVWAVASLNFRVGDHERRLVTVESIQAQDHTAVAVIESKIK